MFNVTSQNECLPYKNNDLRPIRQRANNLRFRADWKHIFVTLKVHITKPVSVKRGTDLALVLGIPLF